MALPVGWDFWLLGKKGVQKEGVEPCKGKIQLLKWGVTISGE